MLTQLDGCIFRLALKNKVPQCIHLKMSQGVLQWRKLEHVQRPLYQSGNPISGTNSERQVMDDDPSSRTRMREVVCDVVRKQSLGTTHPPCQCREKKKPPKQEDMNERIREARQGSFG